MEKPLFEITEDEDELAQSRWIVANARSYWMRWIKGFYFNDQADAFAFLMRWCSDL